MCLFQTIHRRKFKWGLGIFICWQWRRRSMDLKMKFYFVDQIQNILKKFNIFLASVWIDNKLKSPQLRLCCPPPTTYPPCTSWSWVLSPPKVIHTKYSKHWPYHLAATMDCGCSKMWNHGWNHGLFFSLSFGKAHSKGNLKFRIEKTAKAASK